MNPPTTQTQLRPLPLIPGNLTIDPTDAEVRWITGQTCLFCSPLAHTLRDRGYDIPRRAEDEQSAVILWMLALYAAHGQGWKKEGARWLKRSEDGTAQQGPPT